MWSKLGTKTHLKIRGLNDFWKLTLITTNAFFGNHVDKDFVQNSNMSASVKSITSR